MKTITIDYDLYKKELSQATEKGIREGIERATEGRSVSNIENIYYIRDPEPQFKQGEEAFVKIMRENQVDMRTFQDGTKWIAVAELKGKGK